MGIKPCCAMLLLFPLLLGMRDPFMPVDDLCRTAQLNLLQYAGHVEGGQRLIGYLRDENGKWRRAEQGDALNSRWRITTITAESLTLGSEADCEPPQWRVIKGEIRNDKTDKPADIADATLAGRQQKRIAGGG